MRKLRHNLFQVNGRADIETLNSLIPWISEINLDFLFLLNPLVFIEGWLSGGKPSIFLNHKMKSSKLV